MIIEERRKDVFEDFGPGCLLFHGCNLQGAMGAGIAKTIRKKYPGVYQSYKEFLGSYDVELGGWQTCTTKDGVILNGMTQEYWGKKGRACLTAIKHILDDMDRIAVDDVEHYYAVRVGCGLGKLKWDDVRPLFEAAEKEWVIYSL